MGKWEISWIDTGLSCCAAAAATTNMYCYYNDTKVIDS